MEYTHQYEPFSSVIVKVYYNQNNSQLQIVFKNFTTITYGGVNLKEYCALVDANSAGGYYNSNIKRKFSSVHTGNYYSLNYKAVNVKVVTNTYKVTVLVDAGSLVDATNKVKGTVIGVELYE